MGAFQYIRTIIINGIKYLSYKKGNHIQVKTHNNLTSVIVNGDIVANNINTSTVTIKWEGDLARLDCNVAEISGSIHGDVDANTLKVHGNITGNIEANTVQCNTVNGDIEANVVNKKKG